jgi:hypothetical protein
LFLPRPKIKHSIIICDLIAKNKGVCQFSRNSTLLTFFNNWEIEGNAKQFENVIGVPEF